MDVQEGNKKMEKAVDYAVNYDISYENNNIHLRGKQETRRFAF